jgi:AsmA protein
VNLTLEGINSGPLLKDALGFEWLDGRAGIVLALAGQGVSERQMVESLNGTVDFKMLNGNIGGINLPKLVRSVEQGRLPSLDISQAEKTPFSELAATFVIANGIARNQDLRLVSQNARLTGAGTADLPRRLVDYTVNVKLSGSGKPPSEGTVVNFSNLEIPIRVEGSWDNPSFSIKGQEQLLDTIKQIGKNLKSQDVQDAIKGLLRGDPDGRVKPRDLLDKLLKKD